LKHQLDKDIEQSQSNYSFLRRKKEHSENQIKAAKESQQLTLSRYQNGVATFVDLSAAAANVEKASLSKLQDDYQICMENIELARLMGSDF
jgi:outer membrane protein TolC